VEFQTRMQCITTPHQTTHCIMPTHSNNIPTTRTQARLESIGLLWDINKPTKTWDEQFANLKQYKEMHGRWPLKKEQWKSIGNWSHMQRRKYVNKNKMFMEERFAKLDEIGFPWVRNANVPIVPWEDNLRRLLEFHRINRLVSLAADKNGQHQFLILLAATTTADTSRSQFPKAILRKAQKLPMRYAFISE